MRSTDTSLASYITTTQRLSEALVRSRSPLGACILNNSGRGCPISLYLNDTSDGGNEKGPNETVDRNSAPATSL